MEDHLDENALARPPRRKYAQSEASEKISEASGASREVLEDVDGTGEGAPVYQKNKTNVLQALRALRGYCAMSKVEKEAEDGKKALAYRGAVPMVVCGLGEENIRVARIILAAKGYFTLNMRDYSERIWEWCRRTSKSSTRVTGDPTTGNPKQRQNTGSQYGFTHQRLHTGTTTSP
jgi:hypothetical protein